MKRKRTKKLLQQVVNKPKREPRKAIISFRLRESEVRALKDDLARHPSTMIGSLKQFCRKLVVDYVGNALVYADPMNRQTGNYRLSPPTCEITSVAFLKALNQFLGHDEDKWKKLRAFMLGLGYPEHRAKEFRDTLDDYERLEIARKVLARMIKKVESGRS